MNLEQVIRDSRLSETHTFHQLFHKKDMPKSPVLVHGAGAVAVAAFVDNCHTLPYGSVILMGDLSEKYLATVEEVGLTHDWRRWQFDGMAENEFAWVRSVRTVDYPAYGEHLIRAVKLTTGPVLCFGCHEEVLETLDKICTEQDRLLVTVDGTEEVLERFAKFISRHHFVDVETDPSASKWLERNDWGVIFIDHSPGETRKHTVARVRELADFIIVHDTDRVSFELDEVLGGFPHRTEFRNSRPWTTVASTRLDVWGEVSPDEEKAQLQAAATAAAAAAEEARIKAEEEEAHARARAAAEEAAKAAEEARIKAEEAAKAAEEEARTALQQRPFRHRKRHERGEDQTND